MVKVHYGIAHTVSNESSGNIPEQHASNDDSRQVEPILIDMQHRISARGTSEPFLEAQHREVHHERHGYHLMRRE